MPTFSEGALESLPECLEFIKGCLEPKMVEMRTAAVGHPGHGVLQGRKSCSPPFLPEAHRIKSVPRRAALAMSRAESRASVAHTSCVLCVPPAPLHLDPTSHCRKGKKKKVLPDGVKLIDEVSVCDALISYKSRGKQQGPVQMGGLKGVQGVALGMGCFSASICHRKHLNERSWSLALQGAGSAWAGGEAGVQATWKAPIRSPYRQRGSNFHAQKEQLVGKSMLEEAKGRTPSER